MQNIVSGSMWIFLVICWSTPYLNVAHADNHSSADRQKAQLFADLGNASNELEGRLAEEAIWLFWFSQSPDEDVRSALDAGIERREAYDFEAAEMQFDTVVETAPEYSEGFNQRAFVRFLRENYEGARLDLEIALTLEPNHFGALSGMFHILQRQNNQQSAFEMLQQAVEIHPWLKERSSLPKELWPKSYRDIHDPDQEI